jgi:hypothetical protein
MDVLVNDLDADTVLSVWLLEHHARWRSDADLARVRPLVFSVAAVDAHGPAYPAPGPDLALTFHEDVLAPLRVAGQQRPCDQATLDACLARLEAWYGAGLPARSVHAAPPADLILQEEGDLVLATARPGQVPSLSSAAWLYRQGHDRLVLCTPAEAGRYRYTLARRSDLVAGFPLPRFYEALNAAEVRVRGHALEPGQTWGGGSSIGGGPRDGSVLEPAAVLEVVRSARVSPGG